MENIDEQDFVEVEGELRLRSSYGGKSMLKTMPLEGKGQAKVRLEAKLLVGGGGGG